MEGQVNTEGHIERRERLRRVTQLLLQGGIDIILPVVAALAAVCRRIDCDAKEIPRRAAADNRMLVQAAFAKLRNSNGR